METETETGLIYLLKDKTEKCYVGKTIDIKRRIYLHIYDIKNQSGCSSRLLDIDFTYETLEDNIPTDLLDLREQYWYDFYKNKYGDLLVNGNRPLNDIKEYRKQYREDHKDNITQYRIDHKDELKDKAKQYYEDNKDELKDKAKQYYEDNKDEIKEKAKQYNTDHKDIISDRMKQYYKDHKDQYKEYNKKNRAKKTESQKKYYAENKETIMKNATEKINCECGGKYIKSHKSSHFKTKKHIDFCGN